MKLVAVQMRSTAGDIAQNIQRHTDFIERAAACSAKVIVFPEMSLTNYEPQMAETLAMTENDSRLQALQSLSDRHQMLIAVGGPYRGRHGVEVGMFVFRSGRALEVYSKQMLHPDESPYFQAGSRSLTLSIEDEIIVPGICYESLQSTHAQAAKAAGATIYLTSVANGVGGVTRAYSHYPAIARQHGLTVLMANGIGSADDYELFGHSAAWTCDGELVCSASADAEALVVYDLASRTGEILGQPAAT